MINKILHILNYKEKVIFFFIVFLSIVNSVLELLTISSIIPILSFFSLKKEFNNPSINIILDFFTSYGILTFSTIGAVFIIAFFLKSFLSFFIIYCINKFNYSLYLRLSHKIFGNYLFEGYNFHINNHSSKIIRNVGAETNHFAFDVVASILQIVIAILLLFYLCSFLIFVNNIAFLFAFFIFIIFGLLFSLLTNKKIINLGEARHHNSALALKQIQESLGSIKEVILLNVQNYFLNKYSFFNKKNCDSNMISNIIFQTPKIIFEFLIVILILAYLFFSTFKNFQLTEVIITLSIFILTSMKLVPAINKILSSYQTLKYNKTAVNIISKELNKTIKQVNSIKKKINVFKKLSFLDVGFNYSKEDKYIFKSLNFKIKKGEKIGVQGSSGVGKTTFVNLISGLLQPTDGKITVNNLNLHNNKNLIAWRNSIGYVPQKVFLLDDTIKNNILFGRNERFYRINYIFDILKKVDMYNHVNSLPKGIDTIVGENGQKVSGGQAQRIGIARALLHNPSLLILDESTSSLDLNTEKIILNNIYLNFKNQTIISISHKSNALKFCNTIYEVKKNKLIKVK